MCKCAKNAVKNLRSCILREQFPYYCTIARLGVLSHVQYLAYVVRWANFLRELFPTQNGSRSLALLAWDVETHASPINPHSSDFEVRGVCESQTPLRRTCNLAGEASS
jgi:hypothetical protein